MISETSLSNIANRNIIFYSSFSVGSRLPNSQVKVTLVKSVWNESNWFSPSCDIIQKSSKRHLQGSYLRLWNNVISCQLTSRAKSLCLKGQICGFLGNSYNTSVNARLAESGCLTPEKFACSFIDVPDIFCTPSTDIIEDMREECQKYGSVLSLLIPKENPGKGQVSSVRVHYLNKML